MGMLVAYLLGIMSAILPKGVNGKHEKSKTEEESKKPQPSGYFERVGTEINLSTEEAKRYYSEQGKTYKLQRRIFWVNLFTLVILAFYTVFTYCILNATQKSAVAAKTASCIADQTLKRRPYEFRVEQRPYVTLDDFRFTSAITVSNPNGENRIRISFANAGRTPALDFFLDPNKVSILVGKTKLEVITQGTSRAVIGAGKGFAFEIPYALKEPFKTQYENNKLIVTVKGIATYTDVFNFPHRTIFCAQNRHDWGSFLICGEPASNEIDREDSSAYGSQTDCQ